MVRGHEHWLRSGGRAVPEPFPACLLEIKRDEEPVQTSSCAATLIHTGRQARAIPNWRPDPEDRPILRGEKQ